MNWLDKAICHQLHILLVTTLFKITVETVNRLQTGTYQIYLLGSD